MNNKNNKIKVAVGVSGGVDSSVAAALLKEQGYEVIGVFMKFWAETVKGAVRENICCSLESSEDARKVCQKLDIPFYVIDMKAPFKKNIVNDFIDKYKNCLTPNPCVRCNKYIKFNELWNKLKPMGVDFVATGHYVNNQETKKSRNQEIKSKLKKGKDVNKDQSYFLHQVKQDQLKHCLFPLGDYTKDEVRKLAKKYGLPTASKKESQEICFVSDGKLGNFLKKYIKFESGPIVNIENNEKVGEHEGLPLYTIGQRKGIRLPGGPWFVTGFDQSQNALHVSRQEEDLMKKEFKVKDVNWISGQEPKLPFKCKCKVRYRTDVSTCIVRKLSSSKYHVELKKTERAITPGQYCVFYKGDECLGGGEIV